MDGKEETGGGKEMILVWACFTFRLNWFGTNYKLRTHGPRSPVVSRSSISFILSPFVKPLIAYLKAWYKYRAVTKQQASAMAKSPSQLPSPPLQQQRQGLLSCRPSIGPWVAERGSFVPCEIAHGQLEPRTIRKLLKQFQTIPKRTM